MKAVLTVHLGLLIDIEPELAAGGLYIRSPSVPGLHLCDATVALLAAGTAAQLKRLLADNHKLKVEWLTTDEKSIPLAYRAKAVTKRTDIEQWDIDTMSMINDPQHQSDSGYLRGVGTHCSKVEGRDNLSAQISPEDDGR